MKSSVVPFEMQCRLAGLPEPQKEYKFHPKRRWRFDFAWPAPFVSFKDPVALEVQGGLFVQGRHSRGAALLKEHEKLNAAALLGWRILYCTPKQIADGSALSLVEQAIKG